MRNSIIYFIGIVAFVIVIGCSDLKKSIDVDYNYKSIDLFSIVSYKTLRSFQIDSTGRILEFFKSSELTMVYNYNLNQTETDSLKSYLDLIYLSDKNTIEDEDSGCVHGVTYKLTVNTKDSSIFIENVICDDKNIVDEMVQYILNITENKDKQLVFENYMKYQNFLKGADSILNIKTYSDF